MIKKSILFSVVLLISGLAMNAQNSYGIKGGLSYNSNGELKEFLNEAITIIDNKGEGKSGFNIGFYGQLDLGEFFLRPELLYTKTNSEYSLSGKNKNFKMSKIDVPVLVGFKLFGPINVFAGPAFQYILENELKGLNFDKIENDFTVGLNIGASIEIGRIGIDARYERGFRDNEASFIDENFTNSEFRLDSRPEQFIFSLSYNLSKKKQ